MERQMDKCTVIIDPWFLEDEADSITVGDMIEDWVVCKYKIASCFEEQSSGIDNIDFICYAVDHYGDGQERMDIRGRVAKITAYYYPDKRKRRRSKMKTVSPKTAVDVKQISGLQDEGIDGLASYCLHLEDVTITEHTQYEDALRGIIEQINNAGQEIYDRLTGLALNGVWKEWADDQPEGCIISPTEEMKRNTGDKNIDLLWEVLDKMTEVSERFTADTPPSLPKSIKMLDEIVKMPELNEDDYGDCPF